MKYPTMRFVFDRKKVATKTHKGLVQIEVLSEGKRKWIGTGVKVYSDQWNDRKKIINSVEMIQLNQCLDEQLRIIQNWINELISKTFYHRLRFSMCHKNVRTFCPTMQHIIGFFFWRIMLTCNHDTTFIRILIFL